MNIPKRAFFVVLTAFCLTTGVSAADDVFNGTWKLNTAKSKYPAGQAPQSATATVTGENGTHSLHVQTTTADGHTFNVSAVTKDDGTPAAASGSPVFDMMSARKMNDVTVVRRMTKAGKLVGQDRVTASADGKVLTVTGSGRNPAGKSFKFTAVYERQ